MKTLALATLLLATTGVQAASDDSPETQALNHTGTYSGTLPCAVCDGIQTKLTIGDGAYTLVSTRLGLDEDSEEISGVYRTTTDKQYLQLDNQTDRLTFYIGDGYLELRQPDGEKIDPEQPDEDFRLERQ